MEFTNEEIIKDNNKFIHIGKINDKVAIIFSEKEFKNIKLSIDNNNLPGNNTISYKGDDLDIFYHCDKEHLNINKKSKYIIINETSKEYNTKILPYIKSIYETNVKWIHNIINNKSEKDRIFYRDEKIIIAQDISWNSKHKDEFYILTIPTENIMTIRDLRKKHINLLKHMKEQCINVAKKFGVDSNQLYFFFHYHPSFYHLHLHCCIVNHKELSTKYFRCKMLETIVSNLERNSHFYKNGDILFEIPDNHVIAKLLCKM
jgi:m7GpppX diphosphatase